MAKRHFVLKSALTLMLSMLSVSVSAYDFEIDGMYYNVLSIDTLTVEVTYGENKYSGNIVVPSQINFKDRIFKVIRIGENAFKECQITSIFLPETIREIKEGAFSYCYQLQGITFPGSLELIGGDAFVRCTQLQSITIPSNVNYIGWYCFYHCSGLQIVRFNDSRTECMVEGSSTFDYCNSIKKLYIGRPLSYYDNNSHTELTIGPLLKEWLYEFDSGKLEIVRSLIIDPSQLKPTFNTNTYLNATLYVPKGTKAAYKQAEGWSKFFTIEEDENALITESCATPIIEYQNGKLKISSATAGSSCFYSINATDVTAESLVTSDIDLSATYVIKAYATAPEHTNSETVTATLCWLDGQLETDGVKSMVAEKRPVIITSDKGFLLISGLSDNERVSVYSIDGKLVSSTLAHSSIATTDATMLKDGIAIIRIGDESFKVFVK